MVNSAQQPRHAPTLSRAALTRRLVSRLGDEAIVAGIGFTNFDLWSAGPRPQNFYMLGSMGLAFPIALGLAIAQPQRQIIALEGDGSLLMQIGALATIASRRPPNLTMVVWDNGAYQITGGQPTATAGAADLVGMARAAGLGSAEWIDDEGTFDRTISRCLDENGPHFIGVRVDHSRPETSTPRQPAAIREAFMCGIGVRQPLLSVAQG